LEETYARTTLPALRSTYVVVAALYAAISLQMIQAWSSPEAFFTRVVELQPNSGLFRIRLANAIVGQKPDLAAVHLKKALELDPNDWVAHVNLGQIYSGQGRWQEAVAAYQAALASADEDLPAALYLRIGEAYEQSGDPEAALRTYEQALALEPDSPQALEALGGYYFRREDWTKAEEVLQQEIAAHPNRLEARLNLGAVYLAQRRLDDAAAQIQAVLQLDPANADAHFNLGQIYREQGRLADAESELQLVLRLNPAHELARQVLAELAASPSP
jgi:tetratricopeptide (TPR) repeat protein